MVSKTNQGNEKDKTSTAHVLEINCRLGDPEAQVLLPGLQDEFLVEAHRTAQGKKLFWGSKSGSAFSHDGKSRVFVVGSSPEYPYESAPLRLLKRTDKQSIETSSTQTHLVPSAVLPGAQTSGGRAFGILAEADSIPRARALAYAEIQKYRLDDEKPHFRSDIAQEWEKQ